MSISCAAASDPFLANLVGIYQQEELSKHVAPAIYFLILFIVLLGNRIFVCD
jgi:hypothetical protein